MTYHTSMKPCDSMKFCGSGVVGTKGQVVIPKELRQSQGLEEGEKVIFISTPQEGVFAVMKASRLNVLTQNLESKLKSMNELIKAED